MFKKLLISFFITLLLFSYAEAKIITIDKTGREILPNDKSPDQVVESLKFRLQREATAQVGSSMITNTEVKDGKITKDEVITNTAAVAKAEQVGKTRFITDNDINYIEITMRYKIDDEDVNNSIKRFLESENDKKKIQEQAKRIKELEEQTKNMSKDDYNKSGLKAEISALDIAKQKRVEEMKKAADNAHRELEEFNAKIERNKLEMEASLMAAKLKMDQEDLERQKKYAQVKDEEAKNMIKYQEDLSNIIKRANANASEMTFATTIDEVLVEVKGARVEFDAIIKELTSLKNAKNNELKKSYDNHIKDINNRVYPQDKPKKEKYDTTKSYNQKLEDYNISKKAFEESNANALKELALSYEENIKNNEIENKKAMIKALTPYYERFLFDSKGEYPSLANEATIFFDDSTRNNDHLTIKFTITSSKHKKYSNIYKYDSLNDLMLMNETLELFRAIPQYGVEPKGTVDVKSYLHSYKVLHLGTEKYKVFMVNDAPEILPEIKTYENLFKEIYTHFDDKELTPNQLKLKERFAMEEQERIMAEEMRLAEIRNMEDAKKQKEEQARFEKEEKERLKNEEAERKKYETKAYSDYAKNTPPKKIGKYPMNVMFGGSFAGTKGVFFTGSWPKNMYYDINLRINLPLLTYFDIYLNIAHIGNINRTRVANGQDRYGRKLYQTYNNYSFGAAFGLGVNLYLGTRWLFIFGDIDFALSYNNSILNASNRMSFGGTGKAGFGIQVISGAKPRFRVELFVTGMIGNMPNKEPMYGLGISF